MPIMCQSKDRHTKIFSKFHNKVAILIHIHQIGFYCVFLNLDSNM